MNSSRSLLGFLAAAALVAGCNSPDAQLGSAGQNVGAGTGGCTYDGVSHKDGESFKSTDGCNTCSCGSNGEVACTAQTCAGGCTYDGVARTEGESFKSTDGCNTCSCGPNGEVVCTQEACAGGCTYGGTVYPSGESFPSLDGCNTCSCGTDGLAFCTEKACACNPDKEWWRKYFSADPNGCNVVDCPQTTTGFQNACGCGCEQDPACPESFDCMPAKTCDVKKIQQECPYSSIAL